MNEGSCEFTFSPQEFINRKMSVFYNSKMKFNRDVTVAFVGSYPWKQSPVSVGMSLEASGVRGIRLVKENPHLAFDLHMNDHNEHAVSIMNEQIAKNGVKATCTNLDSDEFFTQCEGFDFIDLDPFGSPVPFLDAAIKRLTFQGVLGVTATDTAALCGTSKNACIRKYWAIPYRGPQMYEIGLRILIRRVQLIGFSNDKGLVPVLSYVKDHYMRVFFVCTNNVEDMWAYHKTVKIGGKEIGPIYTGPLHNMKMFDTKRFFSQLPENSFTDRLFQEMNCDTFLYHEIPSICREHKVAQQPKPSDVVKALQKKGYNAACSVQCLHAVKTTASEKVVLSLIKKMGTLK